MTAAKGKYGEELRTEQEKGRTQTEERWGEWREKLKGQREAPPDSSSPALWGQTSLSPLLIGMLPPPPTISVGF